MHRRLVEAKDEFVYIPIFDVLERMLNNRTIFEEVPWYLLSRVVEN